MANLSEVYFYHVTSQTVFSALPQLLSKAKDIGWTVFIRSKDIASLKLIDDAIWTAQPESFLPHAVLGSKNSEKCDILLGTEEDDSSNVGRRRPKDERRYYRRSTQDVFMGPSYSGDQVIYTTH